MARALRSTRWWLALVATWAAHAGGVAPAIAGHGSVGVGGALIATGDRGDRLRAELVADAKPWGRFGVLAAWRAFDRERAGLVLGGVVYEAATARPRLVIDLHAEAGADLDAKAPVLGGGIRTTLAIFGPLAIALDAGAYLVIDGIDDTRLQLQSATLITASW